ncbi:MAG: WXG100 family type VII secretion target [Candidatus Faecivicinus sp.]
MANDRILVQPEEMLATIQRYNSARDTMNGALQSMQQAMDHLDNCWKGPAWAAYMAKWSTIYGNIKRSDEAMEKAITGLTNTVNEMTNTETNVGSAATALDVGTEAPIF